MWEKFSCGFLQQQRIIITTREAKYSGSTKSIQILIGHASKKKSVPKHSLLMCCSYSSLKSNPNAPNSISNRNSISFWNEMSYHDNECYELIEAKETIFVKKMCENLEGSLNYPFWLYLNGYGPSRSRYRLKRKFNPYSKEFTVNFEKKAINMRFDLFMVMVISKNHCNAELWWLFFKVSKQ